jgi:hypothetical protein
MFAIFPEDLLHALSQMIIHDLAEADMVGGQVLPRNSLQQRAPIDGGQVA